MALTAILGQQTQSAEPIKTTLVDSTGRPLSLVEKVKENVSTPTREDTIETNNQLAKQTELLQSIADSFTGKRSAGVDPAKKNETGNDKLFSAAMGGVAGTFTYILLNSIKFLGSLLIRGISTIGRFLVSTIGRSFVLIPTLIVGAINGLFESIKTAFAGGNFSEIVDSFLVGLIRVVTFGLFEKETIQKGIDLVRNAVKFFIIDPILNLFSSIENLFSKYVFEPIRKVFDPIVNFFENIKTSIENFFNGLTIPEIKFTIPIVNKEVSIGPFTPFKPSQKISPDSESISSPVAISKTMPLPSSTEGINSDLSQEIAPIPKIESKEIPISPIISNPVIPGMKSKTPSLKNEPITEDDEIVMGITANSVMMSKRMTGQSISKKDFEKKFSEQGFTPYQIDQYMEKNGAKLESNIKYMNNDLRPAPVSNSSGENLTKSTIAANESAQDGTTGMTIANTPVTTINNAPTQSTTFFGKSPKNDESSINRYIDRSYGFNL